MTWLLYPLATLACCAATAAVTWIIRGDLVRGNVVRTVLLAHVAPDRERFAPVHGKRCECGDCAAEQRRRVN